MFNMTDIDGQELHTDRLARAAACVIDSLERRVLLAGVDGAGELELLDGPSVVLTDEMPADAVEFADTNLEAAVREALHKPGGKITESDMLQLAKLEAGHVRINSLSGLEYALNLTSLYLSGNSISDLTPLTGLTKLAWLNLSMNNIRDISPLAGLDSLRYLMLEQNHVRDLSPLATMTGLANLHVSGNEIDDLSPLNGLNVRMLTLHANNISDISPLLSMPSLDYLSLGNNLLDLNIGSPDRAVIAALKRRVRSVEVGDQRIPLIPGEYPGASQDVRFGDPLLEAIVRETLDKTTGDVTQQDMLRLTELNISGQRVITSLSGLQYAKNLTWLEAGRNKITDISPLAGLTKLQYLDLGANDIADISILSNLVNLDTLYLGGNRVSDLIAIAGLTKIFELALEGNRISNLTPLAGLTAPSNLYLSGNPIGDFSSLAELPGLRVLVANSSYVTDLSFAAGLTELRALSLTDNQISDLSALAALDNLESLSLHQNWLTDITPLLELSGLKRVEILYNYLDLSGGSKAIKVVKTLEQRGVEVVYESQRELPDAQLLPAASSARAAKARRPRAVVTAGTSDDDAIYIRRAGKNVIISAGIHPGGPVLTKMPATKLKQLVLDLHRGKDLVTLDFSNGDPLAGVNLQLIGGSGGDSLRVIGISDPKSIRIEGSQVLVNDTAIAVNNVDRVELVTFARAPKAAASKFSIHRIKKAKALRLGKSRLV